MAGPELPESSQAPLLSFSGSVARA